MFDKLLVPPGKPMLLQDRDPRDTLGFGDKAGAIASMAKEVDKLSELQNRLWAEQKRAVLLVLQAMDAGGKDGAIRAVFTGVNPQGVRVTSFKAPTPTELAHDYLWRVHNALPARGEIGVFNRSHYEDVLVVRVHKLVPEDRWRRRYDHIRQFEQMLTDEGTVVVKCFLHISADEQRQRFQDRIDDPAKRWKFRMGDLEDRDHWDEFQKAYEEAITETSTKWAPWHVVPADRNWVRNLAVVRLLVDTLEDMNPSYPESDPAIVGLTVT